MKPEQPENPEETTGLSGDPSSPDPPEHAARSRPGDELLGRSLALVRHLRQHCPWDARQTPESLRPYLLEEAHETADAILAGDDDELAGELGDLLLNLAFQVVVAEEREAFGAAEVVRRLEAKMRERHPHVYGDAEHPPDWEEMKAAERRRSGDGPADRERGTEPGSGHGSTGESSDPLAGVPDDLPPASRSLRIQQRAAGVGFDWPDVRGAVAKLREEIAELEAELGERRTRDGDGAEEGEGAERRPDPDGAGRDDAGARAGGTVPGGRLEEEVGDLLFAAVNVARLAGAHPDTALAAANAKFERRFGRLLRAAADRGLDPGEASLEELEALWRRAKAAEADEAEGEADG